MFEISISLNNLFISNLSTIFTRWFKYDRDKLWLVYTQIVPVIFEPPCTYLHIPYLHISLKQASCLNNLFISNLSIIFTYFSATRDSTTFHTLHIPACKRLTSHYYQDIFVVYMLIFNIFVKKLYLLTAT